MESDKKVWKDIEIARVMCQKVTEWNDTYIYKEIPKYIFDQLIAKKSWTDDEGFIWGWKHVWATKVKTTNEKVVVVASKPHKLGYHQVKVLMANKDIKVMWMDWLK